ncbi:MAG: TonB-dependent receptor, partial [Alphaproteobacteria bacterium]
HSGFRIPTLNELYRPFRVGKDVTVANADLAPEHLLGAGIGMDVLLTRPPAKTRGRNGGENGSQEVSEGRRGSHLSFSVFAERLRNGIGNVTIGAGPGLFPDAGFVPAGGALRERRNIPRIRNLGFELGLDLALGAQSRLLVSGLHHGERIRRPPAGAKELRGLRVAQSPRTRFHAEVQHVLGRHWQIGVTLDHLGAAFEDDLNRRRLPAATPIGAWLAYALAPNWKLRLVSDNLFDVRVIDRLDPTGLAHRARPRWVGLVLIRQQG